MDEFNLLSEGRYCRIIAEIRAGRLNDGGDEAELGRNGDLHHATNHVIEFDQMFRATAQL